MELLKVDASQQMRLRCATGDTRNWPLVRSIESSEFRFLGTRFKLRYSKTLKDYSVLLSKCHGVAHRRPFRITVSVESTDQAGRIADVLRFSTCFSFEFRTAKEYTAEVWWKNEDEILPAVPEFRRGLTLIVVLEPRGGEDCTCVTCEFAATDDGAPTCLESLSKDLGHLLDLQDASADVEFRCADADRKIVARGVRAHKSLVGARSPVLAAMFSSDMLEGRTGVATIKDIDADVFGQFLRYLYCGKLDETTLTLDSAMSLYEAGDRFQVGSLTRHCAKWMARNLTVEKSCEVLVLADTHCDGGLAEAAHAFMANRAVPHVFDGWEDFCGKHPELANRFLNRFCKMFKGMSPEGEYGCSKRRRFV